MSDDPQDDCECVNGRCRNFQPGCLCNLFWSGPLCTDDSLFSHPAVYVYYAFWICFWIILVSFQAAHVKREWHRRRWTVFTTLLMFNCSLSAIRIVILFVGSSYPGYFGYIPVVQYQMLTTTSKLCMFYFLNKVSVQARDPKPWTRVGILLMLFGIVSSVVPYLNRFYLSVAHFLDVLVLNPATLFKVWMLRRSVRKSMVEDVLKMEARCTRFIHLFVLQAVSYPLFLRFWIFGGVDPSPMVTLYHSWGAINAIFVILAELSFCSAEPLSTRFKRHLMVMCGRSDEFAPRSAPSGRMISKNKASGNAEASSTPRRSAAVYQAEAEDDDAREAVPAATA